MLELRVRVVSKDAFKSVLRFEVGVKIAWIGGTGGLSTFTVLSNEQNGECCE